MMMMMIVMVIIIIDIDISNAHFFCEIAGTIGERKAMSFIFLCRLLLAGWLAGWMLRAAIRRVQAETPRHSTTQSSPGQVQHRSIGR